MIKAHLSRRYVKPYNHKKIGKALELVCGEGKPIKDASEEVGVTLASVSGWLSRYWFYKKINDPVTIVFKSKV